MIKNASPLIIYEDEQIIVCHKPAGTPTQSSHIGTSDMESLLKNHLFSSRKFHRAKSGEPYLAIIHRLDQPVEGILVFAKNTCRRKGTKPPAHFPRIWEILSCSNIRHSRTAGRLSWKLSRQRCPYKQFRSLYENDSGSKTCQTSLQNNRNIRRARKRKIYRFQIDWHAKTHVPKPQAAAIAKWIFCLSRNPSWHRQTSSDSCANGTFRTPPYRRSEIWQKNHRSYEFRTIFDKTISGRTTSSLRLQANISSSQNRKRDGISDLKLHLS